MYEGFDINKSIAIARRQITPLCYLIDSDPQYIDNFTLLERSWNKAEQ